MPKDRRHASIMFTDIVGYTSLMGSDEDRAFEVLVKNREIHTKLIKQFNGTLIKEMGDGVLISFDLASDAVRCAIDIQKEAKSQEIPLKIGIHEGEMVFEGNDVLGDGVNIASRLESDTPSGCISISGSVYRDIKNKSDIRTSFIEEKRFKNVDEPIKVYKILYAGEEDNYGRFKTKPKIKNAFYIIAGIVLVAIAILFVWKVIPSKEEKELDKSVAVMPFDNESADNENIYFVNGMMEDIRNNLSKIGGLRVISKTSTEKYRDTNLSTSEIGKELNVNYLLEGTVQKLGNQIKIHAQLISVNNDDHIWEDTYERDISDVTKVFKVQSDIAKIIANELNVSITPEEERIIETDPTKNLTAYDYYLKGNEYRQRSSREEDLRIAIQLYEKAIEIDSSFVLAWIGLASSSRIAYWNYYNSREEHLMKTKKYLDYAISLSPNQKEVQLEEGWYYYQCKRDYPKALKILEKLRSEYPKDDDLNFVIGAVYRRMGDFEKSLEYFKLAISLNPSNWRFWLDAGNTLGALRKYSDAEKYTKTAIDLNPSNHYLYSGLLWIYAKTGQIKKAKEFIQKNPRVIDHPNIILTQAYIEVLDKNYEEAVLIIESLSEEAVGGQNSYRTKHLELGKVYRIMGNNELSVKHFESEKDFLLGKLDTVQNDPRLYSSLGIAYAGLGMKKEAIDAGKRAMDILNLSNDAYAGVVYEKAMVRILVMVGEYEDALARLDYIFSRHSGISIEELKLNPFWNPIRDMEGFKAIINNPEYQPK